jgi:hypothetical protein
VPAPLAQRLRTDGLIVPQLTAVGLLGSELVRSLMMSRVPVRGAESE